MGLHTLGVCTFRGDTATIALVIRDATESPTPSFVELNSMIKLISSKAANGLVTAVAEALSHDIPSMIGPSRSPAAVASVPHFAGGHNSEESRAWPNVRQHSNRRVRACEACFGADCRHLLIGNVRSGTIEQTRQEQSKSTAAASARDLRYRAQLYLRHQRRLDRRSQAHLQNLHKGQQVTGQEIELLSIRRHRNYAVEPYNRNRPLKI